MDVLIQRISAFFVAGFFLAAGDTVFAQSREYTLKAGFLYHFAQYVEWPEQAFPNPNSEFIIGILGTDPFDGVLDEIVKNEKVKNRPCRVLRFKTTKEINQCHILYIGQSEGERAAQICSELKDRPILTVSDLPLFARQGGMIRFFTENNKIRFKINVLAAKGAGLTISSRLLRLADLVTTE